METFRKLFALLTPRERRNLYLLFVAVVIMAGLEVVSVAAILPFLSVAADPASVHENVYLLWAYGKLEFDSINQFLVFLGLAAFIALVVSNAFISFATWLKYRYVFMRQHSLSKRLLERYLRQPYEFFLQRNSADLSKNVLSEVQEVTHQLLLPAIKGLAKGIVAFFIVGFLVVMDPLLALIVTVTLGGCYGIIYAFVRRRLGLTGQERVEANQARYTAVNEAFGSIKNIKLMRNEESFLSQYDRPSKVFAKRYAAVKTIAYVPRYALEAVAFGGIILIAVYLISTQGNFQQIIPTLGLYAFAGYRLMPALQQTFQAAAQAKFNSNALEVLYRDLVVSENAVLRLSGNGRARPVRLREHVELRNITFAYAGAKQPALKQVSLVIEANTTVGIVGATGSGKTTLVDTILGLLRPQEGELLVDGIPIGTNNLRGWQQDIGYVPQDIVLTDTTIARNIAFGVPDKNIDMAAVEKAAQAAQIHDFIVSETPYGYETVVGERGVRLSGGQRQRIGIARALYHGPSVLVFDEATSAVDTSTERSIMEAVYQLSGQKTILVVAHRMQTLEQCDKILRINTGCIIDEISYQQMIATNSE